MTNTDCKIERLKYIDSIRALCAVWIFLAHYYASYYSSVAWGPAVLYEFPGKNAIAIFSVLLGYFAAKKSFEKQSLAKSIRNRYLQFAIPLIIITSLQVVVNYATHSNDVILFENIREIFKESLLFIPGELCSPAWCIRDFFIASIIIYVTYNIKYRKVLLLIFSVILCFAGAVWIAICLWGAIMGSSSTDAKKLMPQNKTGIFVFAAIKIAGIAVSVYLMHSAESYFSYMLYGIAAVTIIFVCMNSKIIQKALGFGFLPKIGTISLEIFLLHSLIYHLVRPAFGVVEGKVNDLAEFLISSLITLILIIILSYLLSKLLSSKPVKAIYAFVNKGE